MADTVSPRLYGLPKIHKEGVPLRPIVSFVGSTTYELSKYLCNILSPLVGNTEHRIQNSYDWADKSKQFRLNDDDELVSFDVVLLFTSIPFEAVIQIVVLKLENDKTLYERTSLSPQDIMELLEFCQKSTDLGTEVNSISRFTVER